MLFFFLSRDGVFFWSLVGVDKGLDVLEPLEVALVLLDVCVLGEERGQLAVDAALFEVGVEACLDILDFFLLK